MHRHQSIWKGEKPLFAGNGYGGMSEMAMHYIGGILKHARALAAFTNPTTNSYRRLVPGFEAPVNLAYSSRNRSAAIRIPMYSPSPKAKRVEVRFPDPTCNRVPGVRGDADGGARRDPEAARSGRAARQGHLRAYAGGAEGRAEHAGRLDEALDSLQKDHEFLLEGDVFTQDVIETWIEYKMENEVNAMRLRPSPMEFALYFDI